jgi:hypothetical protein
MCGYVWEVGWAGSYYRSVMGRDGMILTDQKNDPELQFVCKKLHPTLCVYEETGWLQAKHTETSAWTCDIAYGLKLERPNLAG